MNAQHITLKLKHSELMYLTRSLRKIEHLAVKGSADEYLGYCGAKAIIENAWVNLDTGDTAEWLDGQWRKAVQA
ncbi:MAG: hypothetical protein WBP46_18450 [Thiolinea sp.]